MMKRISIALWAALAAFFIACAPASAQWQTPLNTVPLGRGAGTGFSFVPQGTNGQALFGNTGSAPAFRAPAFTDLTGQATLSQLPTIGSNTVLANVTGGSATPTAATVTSILDTICATQGAVLVRNSGVWACVTGTNGQVLTSGGPGADTTFTTIPGTGTVTSVSAGTGMSFTTITASGSVSIDKAAASDAWAAASNKTTTTDILFNAAGAMQSPGGCGTATVTPDFNAGFNFACQLVTATNFTLANPTNVKVGQQGCIYFVQPASGTVVTITFGTNWITAGGVTGKALTATLGARDRLCYLAISSTAIDFTLANNITH